MSYFKFSILLIIRVLFTGILFSHTLQAQEDFDLRINVFDQTSARISNALFRLSNTKRGIIKEIFIDKAEEVLITELVPGKYLLEIQSAGFKPYKQEIEISKEKRFLNIKLEIEEIKVDVEIKRSEQEKRMDEAFNKTWTQEEIDSLPDNPTEIQTELKRRYGDDVVIKVNGFTGGRIPPKEQIASIKVNRSSFDAEFHEIGKTAIDIRTKAGMPKYFGFIGGNINDALFNARNALSDKKLPERNTFLMAILGGPMIKNKTSFNISLVATNHYEKNNIVAVVPNRGKEEKGKSSGNFLVSSIGIDHNINKNYTLNLSYELEKMNSENVGVGELSLSERGFSINTINHSVKISGWGIINKKYVNELRLKITKEKSAIVPNTRTPAIIVLNGFSIGGANVDNNTVVEKAYITDNLLFDLGKNTIKIGGELELERNKAFSADNSNGVFIFTSIDNYQAAKPAIFTQRLGTSQTTVYQTQISLYVQEDVRLYHNFQMGLGIRYEWQNNLRDFNNFSPRLSFVYSPSKKGTIVFRGGAGIFYQWLDTQPLSTIKNNDGRQASDLIIRNPGYPEPFGSGIISQSLPPSIAVKASNLVNPTIFVAQTGFNYHLAKRLNIEALYKFQRGIYQFRSRDLNAPLNGLRPHLEFGKLVQLESSGTMMENSLEMRAEGGLFKGITFDVRYRLAKSISDFGGIFDLPMDNYDLAIEKGASNLDRRHRLTGSLNFLLFKKIQVTPIFRLDSSLPYTITTGKDNNGDTIFNDRPAGFRKNTERGNWFKQVDLRLGWKIPIARRGKEIRAENNSSKNKPDESKTRSAMEIFKSYFIGMDITIQNIFNQTNLQNFVGNQLSPFYRQATSAAPARQIQIGLNFFF